MIHPQTKKLLLCGVFNVTVTPKNVNFCGCRYHAVNCGDAIRPGTFCMFVGEESSTNKQGC